MKHNPQNRGMSGYELISWDEAVQVCADEIRRVIDAYGNPQVGPASANVGYRLYNWGVNNAQLQLF